VLCLSVITAVIVVLAISFSVLNVLHMLNIFGSNQIASAVRQRSRARAISRYLIMRLMVTVVRSCITG